jgi:hypothetical protein
MAIPLQYFLVTNLSNGDSSSSVARWLTLLNCTALIRSTEHGRSCHIASERTNREHRLHHLFCCCVTSPRKRMLQTLHSNGCTRHVSLQFLYYCVQALPSNDCCLQCHLLATGLYFTIWWDLGQIMSFVIFYWNPFLPLNLFPRVSYFIRTVSRNWLYALFCILAQNVLMNEMCKATFGNGMLCYSFLLSGIYDWRGF